MFIDLNQKVEFDDKPYENNGRFGIYTLTDKGKKEYVAGGHFNMHYLDKYPKDIMDIINNESNEELYQNALKEAEKEKARAAKEAETKKEIQAKQENQPPKSKVSFTGKDQVKEIHTKKKVGNANPVKKPQAQPAKSSLSNTFKNYTNNIEKCAQFKSSSVPFTQGMSSGTRKFPKINTSK